MGHKTILMLPSDTRSYGFPLGQFPIRKVTGPLGMRSSQYTFSLLSCSCCSISWHNMFKSCLEERLGFLQNPCLSISLEIKVRNPNKELTSQYACRLSTNIQRTLKVINTMLNSHCATRQLSDFQHTLNITMNVVLSVVLVQVLFHVS